MSYEVWLFTTGGDKVAYMHNAFNIQCDHKANQTPTLTVSYPNDEENAEKAALITSAYEAKVWNTVKELWEGLYTLDDATEQWNASGSIIQASYSGVMGQLAGEDNITYDTTSTPKTPTQIITALLALQENTTPITVGTIEPTTSFAFAVENANLLAALLECANYLGGYMEVDSSRALNWYNEPSGNPTREIRYQKNMKGVTRKRDFTTIKNKIYAYGYGETEAQVTLIDAGEPNEYIEDAASQASYGIRIKRITDKRITHPSTLLLWAQRYLALYKDPVYYYTVDVVNLAEHSDYDFDFENLEVGQIVRVVNSDMNDLNVNVKIVSVSIQLDKPENVSIELANATKDLADTISSTSSKVSLAENVAVQIGAGQVTVQGAFTVEDWTDSGTTKIVGSHLTTGTISAATITLDNTGGNEGILKSGNYVADTSGWQINGDGDAEFNNVTVRGTIATANIGTGETVIVNGGIESSDYSYGVSGWRLGSSVASTWFKLLSCDSLTAKDHISVYYDDAIRFTDTSGAGPNAPLMYTNSTGTHLYFKNSYGNETQIV